jgi:hypothetical protein
MPAPQQRRSWDEFADAALAIIKPSAEQREAIRAKLAKDIALLRDYAQALQRAPIPSKTRLDDYLKALRATKRKHSDWPSWTQEEQKQRRQFLALIDYEIDRVASEYDYVSVIGHRRPNRIAFAACERAAEYLKPEQRTLTGNGPWHLVTKLLYESATGEAGRDLMHVLRQRGRIRAPKVDLTL